jgi:hypothetical protein
VKCNYKLTRRIRTCQCPMSFPCKRVSLVEEAKSLGIFINASRNFKLINFLMSRIIKDGRRHQHDKNVLSPTGVLMGTSKLVVLYAVTSQVFSDRIPAQHMEQLDRDLVPLN